MRGKVEFAILCGTVNVKLTRKVKLVMASNLLMHPLGRREEESSFSLIFQHGLWLRTSHDIAYDSTNMTFISMAADEG